MNDPEPISPEPSSATMKNKNFKKNDRMNTGGEGEGDKKVDKDQYYVGIFLLLIVVALWVGSSFIMSSMFREEDWNQPWLVTYLCTSSFSIYLIRPTIDRIRQKGLKDFFNFDSCYKNFDKNHHNNSKNNNNDGEIDSNEDDEDEEEEEEEDGSEGQISSKILKVQKSSENSPDSSRGNYSAVETNESIGPNNTRKINSNNRLPSVIRAFSESERPLRIDETAKLALNFVFLWFAANWTVNAALGYTSVSSTTILSSMSGFFTLLIGSTLGVENFNLIRFLAVGASLTGVILVSKSDHDSSLIVEPNTTKLINDYNGGSDGGGSGKSDGGSHALIGDFLALSSAVLYAFYVILMKVKVKDESRVDMQLFFGFVGVINLILFWPIGILLNFTGIEVFELPRSSKVWFSILVNCLCTFTSDYIYMLAMLKTSPLVVTLGLSLTLPVAVLGDLIKGEESLNFKSFLGGSLVLLSFGILSLFDKRSQR